MKINCMVIKDLLPLYFDGILSEESKELIEKHLSICENCKAIADQTSIKITAPNTSDNLKAVQPFKKLKRSRARTLIITISISVIFCFLGFSLLLPHFDPLLSTYDEFLGISQSEIISGSGYTNSLTKMIAEKENWNESEIECEKVGAMGGDLKDIYFERWIKYQGKDFLCDFHTTRNIFGVYKILSYDIASYNSETEMWTFKYSGQTFKPMKVPEG